MGIDSSGNTVETGTFQPRRNESAAPGNGAAIPAARAPTSKEKQANARESYDFWRGQGLTHAQAVGMVGNEQGEGGLASVPAHGDAGAAGGIFQWHGDRRNAILQATGIDVWSPNTTHAQQLQAAAWELKHGAPENRNWDRIVNSKTTGETVWNMVHFHERSANQQGDWALRTGYANQWNNSFAQPEATQEKAAPVVKGGADAQAVPDAGVQPALTRRPSPENRHEDDSGFKGYSIEEDYGDTEDHGRHPVPTKPVILNHDAGLLVLSANYA
jgi:hypothetical protein